MGQDRGRGLEGKPCVSSFDLLSFWCSSCRGDSKISEAEPGIAGQIIEKAWLLVTWPPPPQSSIPHRKGGKTLLNTPSHLFWGWRKHQVGVISGCCTSATNWRIETYSLTVLRLEVWGFEKCGRLLFPPERALGNHQLQALLLTSPSPLVCGSINPIFTWSSVCVCLCPRVFYKDTSGIGLEAHFLH